MTRNCHRRPSGLASGISRAWKQLVWVAKKRVCDRRATTWRARWSVVLSRRRVDNSSSSSSSFKWHGTMTRSKIQKMKFFVFLLIFLLAQTAICDGSFRERRDATAEDKKIPLVNEKTNKGVEPSARVQQNAAGSSSDAKKPATDGNKTQDNITSKSSPLDVTANRTHIVDNEVRIIAPRIGDKGCLVRSFLVQKIVMSYELSWQFISDYHWYYLVTAA